MHILGAGQHRGKEWAAQNPGIHVVNPGYRSVGKGQVEVENGAQGSRKSVQHRSMGFRVRLCSSPAFIT